MAEEGRHREQFDEYADAFTITITPFGANLSFGVREPHPPAGRVPNIQNLGTVRMSVEHLKIMVMIVRRQVVQVEAQSGIKAEVSREILNQLQIPFEDWDALWRLF